MESADIKPDTYYQSVREEIMGFIPRDAARILEVGCGEGLFGQRLKEGTQREIWGQVGQGGGEGNQAGSVDPSAKRAAAQERGRRPRALSNLCEPAVALSTAGPVAPGAPSVDHLVLTRERPTRG